MDFRLQGSRPVRAPAGNRLGDCTCLMHIPIACTYYGFLLQVPGADRLLVLAFMLMTEVRLIRQYTCVHLYT